MLFLDFLLLYINISNKAHLACDTKYNNSWYIELLAVSPDYKGKGLGSKMIYNCLIPYAKLQGANTITLITNTKNNCKFYEKNGFIKFSEYKLEWKDKYIMNYSFIKNI